MSCTVFLSNEMNGIILSDGKPGHYNQSLGIIQCLQECDAHWIDVRFRSKWHDNLLRCIMCVLGGVPLPKFFTYMLLRYSVCKETYTAISCIETAQLILSTGSSVAAVNLLLGKTLNAKTVTCRRPSPLGIFYFDLAILPRLKLPRIRRKNVFQTLGVPNAISPAILAPLKAQLQTELALPNCPRIGVLVGGTERHETFTEQDAARLLDILEETTEKLDAQVLVTTSRRTPRAVSNRLATVLKPAAWCPLFIEPGSYSALTAPYQALLALSDVLVVTADSFSMVCEAASSGRPVILLTHSRAKQSKRYQAYHEMEQQAILQQCELQDLEERLSKRLKKRTPSGALDDTRPAANAIRGLFN